MELNRKLANDKSCNERPQTVLLAVITYMPWSYYNSLLCSTQNFGTKIARNTIWTSTSI